MSVDRRWGGSRRHLCREGRRADDLRLGVSHHQRGGALRGVGDLRRADTLSEFQRVAASRDLKQEIFYTAMYHAMQLPRIFSDVSGTYPSFAGGGTTGVARGFTYYCDLSLWDTFRALHPLLTVIDVKREGEMMRSLIEKGKQGGFLPIFPAWNSYTSEMTGDHAVAAIGDAYLKGIRGFDIDEAYRLMRKNAVTLPSSPEEYRDGQGRRALDSYLKYGYIPLEDHVNDAFHKDEQVSRTLDYAYDDFVLGEVAQKLGKTADAEMFLQRAKNYRNVIDPETGFARGRHEDGTWITPFDPGKPATYITEGLPFQYTFFVPQDVPSLIALEHGAKGFVAKLNELFARGYYDQGNEPSHHIAYLYDYAGAACEAQKRVHEITSSQYKNQVDGMSGNDDAGQMSAWYLLSALGFYPVTPGIPAYEIGTPHFREATLHLAGGKQLHILANGLTANTPYIRSATLNGHPLNRFWLGAPSSFTQANGGTQTAGHYRQNYFGYYAQDTFHPLKNLTVNYGVRWEPWFPTYQKDNKRQTFSLDAFNAGRVSDVYVNAPASLLFNGDRGVSRGFITSKYLDFSPRVGLALDPDGKGRQSLRASYSLLFDEPSVLQAAQAWAAGVPFGQSQTITLDNATYKHNFDNPWQFNNGVNPFPTPPASTTVAFPTAGITPQADLAGQRRTYMHQ